MDEAPAGTGKLPDAQSATNAVFLGDIHHNRTADPDADTDTDANANSDANTNLGFLMKGKRPAAQWENPLCRRALSILTVIPQTSG